VPQSVNKGEPVVLSAPKSGVTQAMNQLADLFVKVPSDKRKRK
jgi:MinD-like ATPase involved in chromosome partitioning or flagellar assembly